MDRLAKALEELQNAINHAILVSGSIDPKLREQLNELRSSLFKIENEAVIRHNLRLDYMIGFATIKELEEFGR